VIYMAKHDVDHHLHLRAGHDTAEGPWRISLESIDGWALRTGDAVQEDKGPFARLLGTP
jgi:hypothetical protein